MTPCTPLTPFATNVAFSRNSSVATYPWSTTLPVSAVTVGSLSLGYLYERPFSSSFVLGVGVQGLLDVVPASIAPSYGGQVLPGAAFYFRLRPTEMAEMSGMAQAMR